MSKWMIAAKKANFDEIAKKFGISPVLARVIRNRDVVSDEEINCYLNGGRSQFHSPWLLKDMDKLIAILEENIIQGKKIRVIGDYDVDGICAAYVLFRGIERCKGIVDTVIPHRIKDGYGLNDGIIKEAKADEIDAIITCDNGIAAAKQALLAIELDITLLITDHHEVPFIENKGIKEDVLPKAAAIVDPKRQDCTYPFKGICGAAVAFKIVTALFQKIQPENLEETLEELLEIVAFATVCDVMELRDENRLFVKCGLENMKYTRNRGLQALIDVCQLEQNALSAYHLGFVLGPCMNAAGRLDTAERALTLLKSQNRAEAVDLAQQLKSLNESRKEMTVEWTQKAITKVEREKGEDKVLVLYLPGCHESLAGIIAGRIREKYGRPTFVLTDGEDGIKGSGRSIEAYHMFEEMSQCKELFVGFGGHKMAAGLSMEGQQVETFRKILNDTCKLSDEDFEEKVSIDVALPFSYVTAAFLQELERLEPFGVGNTKPVFGQKEVHIIGGKIIGKNKNVGKYQVKDESGICYEIIFFGDLDKLYNCLTDKVGMSIVDTMYRGATVDIPIGMTYYPTKNSYGGVESVQFVMQNFR